MRAFKGNYLSGKGTQGKRAAFRRDAARGVSGWVWEQADMAGHVPTNARISPLS